VKRVGHRRGMQSPTPGDLGGATTKARRARPFTAATHLSSLALLGLAAASGCAFGARHVDVTYPASLAGPGGVAASGARVAVAKLGDAREPRQGTGRLARQGPQSGTAFRPPPCSPAKIRSCG
jgi:hypothetical protein